MDEQLLLLLLMVVVVEVRVVLLFQTVLYAEAPSHCVARQI